MTVSAYLKPVIGTLAVVALGVGYWMYERSPRVEPKETQSNAVVIVTKSTNACFSDMVRVTGFVVPRREAVVSVDTEGSRVTDLMVREGDVVTENQEIARLSAPPAAAGGARPPISLRASAAGLVTQVNTIVGAPASPQAGPMFKIAANNQFELDAEVPGIHMLKINPGATARITRDNQSDIVGRVRQVLPKIDRASQLGHVRISLPNSSSIRAGTFAKAAIDAKRSCGVAVPRSAIDHLTIQVVKGDTIETRKVRTGLVSETSTEIVEGLDVGEIVVADAGTSLHDGDQIKTIFADELDRSRVR